MKPAARDDATFRFEPVRKMLARPALHVVLALLFAGAFLWPMFAMEKPAHTFKFLYLGWGLCLVVLFAVSRGVEVRDDEETEEDPAGGGRR
jgi:hypothetical protein